MSFGRLDLPYPMMLRLAAWQEDWENIPQGVLCETRWEANLREETAIAREQQRVLGPGTTVLVDRDGKWCWIEEVLESTAPEENSLDLAG